MDGICLYNEFLRIHKPQLELSGIPLLFWQKLYKKLKDQIFDSGLVFRLARIDYDDNDKREATDPIWKLFTTTEISSTDEANIYLVDHAWTYSLDSARRNLEEIPGLLDRMCSLMGFVDIEETIEKKIEYVLDEMWRYNQSYALKNATTIEDRMPIWYIMDEVGSAVNHSDGDEANFRAVPFLNVPEGVTYTVFYPLRDLEENEEVTRDFIHGQYSDSKTRRALLLPWKKDESLIDEDFIPEEADGAYFLQDHTIESFNDAAIAPLRNPEARLKVFSQYNLVDRFLTDDSFEIVSREQDADILWLTEHFKEYAELSVEAPNIYVNQFPFEHVLTVKDLLCIVCRRKAGKKKCDFDTLETFPAWLPTTYNLKTELVKFVSYFERRRAKGLDNHWICKPWNLARGLDTHITSNLYHILRLPGTGPKIAQKYITDPVLYNREDIGRVKFDIRYVVLLKTVKPLKSYVYKNFFLRFANKEFSLDRFDDYEKHFTVMNYVNDGNNTSLYHLKCADFINEWKKQYELFSWSNDIEKKIFLMLKEIFEAAVQVEPPMGIANNFQSRAVYAADIMLEWRDGNMQPVILEVNFTPDCKRACDYYPNFYNDIFKNLFLDDENPTVFQKL